MKLTDEQVTIIRGVLDAAQADPARLFQQNALRALFGLFRGEEEKRKDIARLKELETERTQLQARIDAREKNVQAAGIAPRRAYYTGLGE